MKNLQLKSDIRNFVVENFLYGKRDGLEDDVSFLEKGLIDSTGVLELVAFVEDKYGISVDDEELVPENFDSINRLSDFIIRKTGTVQSQQMT
jgi:acyl carrier protein